MNSMTLSYSNGHAPASNAASGSDASQHWLEKSTRHFFSEINWDNQSQEVQQLRQAWVQDNAEPLSLTLSVHQFFAAIPWDGVAVFQLEPPSEPLFAAPESNSLTLEDFSDLF